VSTTANKGSATLDPIIDKGWRSAGGPGPAAPPRKAARSARGTAPPPATFNEARRPAWKISPAQGVSRPRKRKAKSEPRERVPETSSLFSLHNLASLPVPALEAPLSVSPECSSPNLFLATPMSALAEGTQPESEVAAPTIAAPTAEVIEAEPVEAKLDSDERVDDIELDIEFDAELEPERPGYVLRPRPASEDDVAAFDEAIELWTTGAANEAWYSWVGSAPIDPPPAKRDEPAFSEAECAFFDEGEQLAAEAMTVEQLLDVAEEELSFWQRLWRKDDSDSRVVLD